MDFEEFYWVVLVMLVVVVWAWWMGEPNWEALHNALWDMDRKIIGEQQAEIERLKQINHELWTALTPEKRHELNLKWKELSDDRRKD